MDIAAKKKYICETALRLPYDDRYAVLMHLIRAGMTKFISDANDGSRVLLDKLPEDAINGLYGVVFARSKNIVVAL